MLKALKLKKAVYLIILGVLILIAAQLMRKWEWKGSSFMLGVSGAFLVLGALFLLYPVLFAKKVDKDGKNVELQPMGEEEGSE